MIPLEEIQAEIFGDLQIPEDFPTEWHFGENTGFGILEFKEKAPTWTRPTFKIKPSLENIFRRYRALKNR